MKQILFILVLIISMAFFTNFVLAKNANRGDCPMMIDEVIKKDSVINYFVELARIPSPSAKENKLSSKIIEILTKEGIKAKKDNYGNIIAVLEANKSKSEPVILSSHMDVVGSDDAVNIRVSKDGKYIETDKTRTLGSDDKAGCAVIVDILIYFKKHPEIAHPKIEATFTKEEETGMYGMSNLDTTKLTAQNALILDGSDIGECNVAGAGFTNLTISVTDGKSGHSGIDIGDKSRISANKVLAEIVSGIPQGVYKKDKTGTVTSINSGSIIGGSAGMYLLSNKNSLNINSQKQIMEEITANSFRNIIAANAYVNYSIRSSEPENEKQLHQEIIKILDKAAKKYEGKIKIEYEFEEHLKPFVKDDNEVFLNIVLNAAKQVGLNSTASSFHAAAETHILQNSKLNASGKRFKPLLLGVANIYNMHSPDEQLEFETLIQGRNWVKEIIIELK